MIAVLIAVLIVLLGLTAWHERREATTLRWTNILVTFNETAIEDLEREIREALANAFALPSDMFQGDVAGHLPASVKLARKIYWKDYDDIDGS